MHALPPPVAEKKVWDQKLVRSAYFVGAVLLHLILFIMLASLVIWRAPEPPPSVFQAVSAKPIPPPPPVPPPASGAAAANPEMEPQQVTVPIVAPPSVITAADSTFKMDAPKVDQALSHVSLPTAQGSGLGAGESELGSGSGAGFGSSNGSGNMFSGYFYDLKQTSDRQGTKMTQPKWRWIMAQYIAQGWDESILKAYFRSSAPIYTSSFAISTRMSVEAPKAFHLDVQPALWAIHYHAKVAAPEGDYRMIGFGDDVLEVKVAGTFVLDAGWISLSDRNELHEALPTAWSRQYTALENDKDRLKGMGPTNGLMKMGPVFHMDQGATVDMDVLIGDQGGKCAYYLLIQKVGNLYQKQADGNPLVPFFEIGTSQAPTFSGSEEHPPFSGTAEPWQGVNSQNP